MQIHLVIPGLIWPGASVLSPVAGLELPALAYLLGRGRRAMRPFEPLDRELARAFLHPLPESDETTLPLAAIRHLGENAAAVAQRDAHWLCADPVNLSFAREHLLLNEFPDGDLSEGETQAMLESLNAQFGDLGHFEACAPNRWYLRLAQPAAARFYPLHDVIGRPIKDFLPEGADARLWQRSMNEIQILLHNHPVNEAREARGQRAANSVWFWGAGALASSLPRPAPTVQAGDPLAAGFARAAGIAPEAPDCAKAMRSNTLVVLDTLLKPALQLDIDRWRSELQILERDWFAPLRDALRTGRLNSLVLTAPGDRGTLALTQTSADRWKFWRKPLPLARLIQSVSAPALTPQPPSRQ